MKTYHKIQTVFKRDPKTDHKTLLDGEYALPEFEYLKNSQWVFTEKIDGTNIRIGFKDGIFKFGGRTDRAEIHPKLLDFLKKTFSYSMNETFLKVFGCNYKDLEGVEICLYGEGYGEKIQKGGGRYMNRQGFILFDVMINGWWLNREDVEDIGKSLGIDVVPVVGKGTLEDMVNWAKAGIPSTFGDFECEGIVARPEIELRSRGGERIIAKIKCKDFIK